MGGCDVKMGGRAIVTTMLALCLSQGQAQVRLETEDGLRIGLAAGGRVSSLNVDGSDCLNPEGAWGFELVDVAAGQGAELGGSVISSERGARQEATLDALGLAFEADYVVHPDHLEIVGAVRGSRLRSSCRPETCACWP